MAVNPNLVDDLSEQVMYADAPGVAEQQSFFADVLEAMPTMTTAAAVKSARGGSTFMYGGRGDMNGPLGMRRNYADSFLSGRNSGVIRGGMRNLMYRPGNVRTFATRGYFGVTPDAGSTRYTPFYSSSIANAVPRAAMDLGKSRQFNALMGSTGLSGALGKGGRWSHLVDQETGEMASRGFASRISASARIGAMSQSRFAASASSLGASLESGINLAGMTGRTSAGTIGMIGGLDQLGTAQLTAMSGSGPLTSRMGAWVAASQGDIGEDVFRTLNNAKNAGGRGAAAAGVARDAANSANRARQVAQVGSGKVGVTGSLMRAAGNVTGAGGGGAAAAANLKLAGGAAARVGARFAGPVGWALLAYDASRFIGRTTARTISTATAAVGSYTAPSRTGIMQQSFTDNEVTRTSRARGVSAIQNSRLNARSVLGNESAAMSRHFG